jgi:hypothetical protein
LPLEAGDRQKGGQRLPELCQKGALIVATYILMTLEAGGRQKVKELDSSLCRPPIFCRHTAGGRRPPKGAFIVIHDSRVGHPYSAATLGATRRKDRAEAAAYVATLGRWNWKEQRNATQRNARSWLLHSSPGWGHWNRAQNASQDGKNVAQNYCQYGPKRWVWIKKTKINLKTAQKQRGEVKMTKLRLKTTKMRPKSYCKKPGNIK